MDAEADASSDARPLTGPLHDRHVTAGAKLADFGGWSMPLEYPGGGVLAEHAAVRTAVGVFDVSHLGKASVLGPGAVVEVGAVVEDSVLFGDVVVEAGAEVRTCIVDDNVDIGRGARVGAVAPSNRPRDKDITLIGRDSRIARNAVVEAGARLEPGTRA